EVIGGLIEQQQIGLQRECESECSAFTLAARARRRRVFGIKIEPLHEFRQTGFHPPSFALVSVQMRRLRLESCACEQALAKCGTWRELRLLLHEGDSQTVTALHFAVIELRQPCDDPRQ